MIKYFIYNMVESAFLSVDNDFNVSLDRARRFDTSADAQNFADSDPVCPNGYYEIREVFLKS